MSAVRLGLAVMVAGALGLGACDSFTLNKYDPASPENAEDMGSAADARAEMSRRCGPMGGEVRQKDDTKGTRSGDWECAERSPR